MMLEHLDTFIAFGVVMLGVSLLITVLTQMIAALFGLRGSNLKWGIEVLVRTIDPTLADHAEKIAHKILRHPVISDSTISSSWLGKTLDKIPLLNRLYRRWALANAIRIEELVEILRRSTANITPPANTTAAPTWTDEEAMAWLLEKIAPDASVAIPVLAQQLNALAPGRIAKAREITQQIIDTAQNAVNKAEPLFNSTMDRVTQRFVVHTRLWTMVFAVLIAFALHLDAFRLLGQLSTDAELRASLVASADAMTKQADEILGTTASSPFNEAIQQLKEQMPEATNQLGDPPALETRSRGEEWLRAQLQTSSEIEAIVQKYNEIVQAILKTRMNTLKEQAQSVRKELADAQFRLIPDYSQHVTLDASADSNNPVRHWDFWPGWPPRNTHFWGILAAAALLSLGAPFWFNILRTLSNLRPILATKQQREQEQRAASA